MFILLCVDEKNNSLIFRRKETESVFEYQIKTESWKFICPWAAWIEGFSSKYGVSIKRKKKNG